jgi:hypothetical protein
MAGSSSQASTLVQRGGATGENRVATRSTPSGTVGRRRPSSEPPRPPQPRPPCPAGTAASRAAGEGEGAASRLASGRSAPDISVHLSMQRGRRPRASRATSTPRTRPSSSSPRCACGSGCVAGWLAGRRGVTGGAGRGPRLVLMTGAPCAAAAADTGDCWVDRVHRVRVFDAHHRETAGLERRSRPLRPRARGAGRTPRTPHCSIAAAGRLAPP